MPQVIFDVRFGGNKTDVSAAFWSLLQSLVYGMLAAVAGSFHIGYGLPAYLNPVPDHEISPYVDPPNQLVDRPSIVRRSLKVTFGVYATSRFLLFIQYGVVMVQARRHDHSRRPAFFAMCGLLASGSLFFAGMTVDWDELGNPRSVAYTRILILSFGWLIKYAATVASVLSSASIAIELEYWTERFAALTLVILGEGVFGLFESYRSTFVGPTGGFNSVLIAIVIAAVGLYRVLYYLYFSTFTRHLRSNTTRAHLTWGLLHLPAHLSLLLLMQAAVRNIRSISIFFSAEPFIRCQMHLDSQLVTLIDQEGGRLAVPQYQELLLNSESGKCLNHWSTYMGVDRISQINLYASIASNNITLFGNLCQAESYSLLLKLWSSFQFEAEAEVYNKINGYISGPQNDSAPLGEALDILFAALYTAAKPAIPCFGALLVFLAALGYFQPVFTERFGHVKLWFRASLGIIMLLLMLLNLGTTSFTQQTPLDNLLHSNWLVPFLFFAGFSVVLVDGILHVCKVTKHAEALAATKPLADKDISAISTDETM